MLYDSKNNYDCEKYEDLFDINFVNYQIDEDADEKEIGRIERQIKIQEERIESSLNKNISFIRVKTIKAGNQLYSEIYPVWQTNSKSKRIKKQISREAQKNLNNKNAQKHLIRLINNNFEEGDLIIDLTYKGKPPDLAQGRRDIQNYIRRLRDYRKKRGLPDLKYVYVMETKRLHFHMVINKMDRDDAEELWGKGRANTDRLQPDEYGLEGKGRYIIKDPKGTKRWCASRNLIVPVPTVADSKLTKRDTVKIAKNQSAAKELFEKIYKGYIFNDIDVKFSDYVSGAYIYVRMRREKLKCG